MLAICFSNLSLSGNETNNTTNDSLFNIYLISKNDSIHISMLVQLAANMEANSTLHYKNNTVDDYLQLANLKSNDSASINNLAYMVDMIGVKFRNRGDYVSALKFHNWAKDIADRIDNKNQHSIIYNNIGVVYRRLDDYNTALANHIMALQLSEETRNIKSQAIAINSIGNIQMMIGNLDESLEYFKQSLILEQKLDNLLGIAINLNNIGNVYAEKGDFANALEYYFLSLDVNKEISSDKGIAICYNDIGNIYERLSQFDKAFQYYLDAFNINNKLGDRHSLANSYIQIGELYTDQGQFDKAMEYLLPGLDISIEIGAKVFIMDTYHALYRIKRANKDYEDAFEYLQLSNQYNDSIININVRKEVARLHVKFESERKENHIELLEQNAEISELDDKRKNFIILLSLSAFIIALGFVIFLSYYLFTKNKTNKLLIERNKIIEKTKAELDSYSKQLLKAKQEAERNSRIKGEFLANMSHEIRTPLNSVIGFAELLSDSVTDPKQLNHLKIIKSSSRTLLTLINDILDLSKIEAGKFNIDYENIDVEQIFEDIIQIFSHSTLEKGINLKTSISSKLPKIIFFSELRLRQILFNLVGNAIKFTDKGSISIVAYSEEVISNKKINLFIKIVDTGIGIQDHELKKIFEPFSHSDVNKKNHGTGLGLTITKRLVENMNGNIEVDSHEGEGTSFSIFFPNIDVVNDNVIDENKLSPFIEKNEFVNTLFYTNEITECKIQNIKGIDQLKKDIITNLEGAKSIITDKNLVIICGFSIEKSKNALNVLRQSKTSQKVRFIVLSEDEVNDNDNTDNVVWLKKTTSNKNFARILNNIFSKIAFEGKSNLYFHDFINNKTSKEFRNSLEKVYIESFKLALETKMSGNIVGFLESLKDVANTYKSSGLLSYCTDLNSNIINFDIEEIDKLLDLFNTNYLQIQK